VLYTVRCVEKLNRSPSNGGRYENEAGGAVEGDLRIRVMEKSPRGDCAAAGTVR
jgi:hypothetical protein